MTNGRSTPRSRKSRCTWREHQEDDPIFNQVLFMTFTKAARGTVPSIGSGKDEDDDGDQ